MPELRSTHFTFECSEALRVKAVTPQGRAGTPETAMPEFSGVPFQRLIGSGSNDHFVTISW